MCNDNAIKDHSRSKEERKINQETVLTIILIPIILVRKLTIAMSVKMPR